MSVTIIEALQNANYNLQANHQLGIMVAKEQVHNVAVLLEKGYDLYDEVEPLLDKYGTVENVPDKEREKE